MHGLFHRVENRNIQDGLSTLAGGDSGDHVGAVLDHPGSVKGSFLAGYSLDQKTGVFVYENTHCSITSAFPCSND